MNCAKTDAHAYDGQLQLKIEALQRMDLTHLGTIDAACTYFAHAAHADERREQILRALDLIGTDVRQNMMQGVDAAALLLILHKQCLDETDTIALVLEQLSDIMGGSCPSGRVHRLLQLVWC